jgi:hypothetical protein
MKNTFFKPVAFSVTPVEVVAVVVVVFFVLGLYIGKVLHLPQTTTSTTTTQGWYNKATLRSLGTLFRPLKEGKKNNTYYPSILNQNTLKNINKFKVRLYYSNQLNIRYSLNLPHRLCLIQNQLKYYHISNIRAVKRIGPHNLGLNNLIYIYIRLVHFKATKYINIFTRPPSPGEWCKEEVLSVIRGSILGDGCCAQPFYIKNSFTTLNLPLNPN